MAAWLGRNWFLVALTAALAAAALHPEPGAAGGALGLDLAKSWMIAGIFLISGLTLPTRELGSALGRVRAHVFVQGFGLALVPALVLAIDPLLAAAGLAEPLRHGLLVLACLPTTIGICIALTRAGGGDEAMAVCESALGNVLGVLITPALVLACTGRAASVPTLDVLYQLALMVGLPLVLGQCARLRWGAAISARRARWAAATSLLLLVLIYHIFCASFARGWNVPRSHLLAVAGVVVGLHAILLAAAHALSGLAIWQFERPQRIAATICSTQKTAAMGVPLLTILYGTDPALPLLSAPLLMYHFLQLVVATALVPVWRRWADGPTAAPAANGG